MVSRGVDIVYVPFFRHVFKALIVCRDRCVPAAAERIHYDAARHQHQQIEHIRLPLEVKRNKQKQKGGKHDRKILHLPRYQRVQKYRKDPPHIYERYRDSHVPVAHRLRVSLHHLGVKVVRKALRYDVHHRKKSAADISSEHHSRPEHKRKQKKVTHIFPNLRIV